MKRFYASASVIPHGAGHAVQLDGRPVRTPSRALLVLPNAALAQAIAGEWDAQGDSIDPRTMRLTGLANAAIDMIAPKPDVFVTDIARYGETDLLCYRAEGPAGLVQRQAEHWDPLLDWARKRYDIAFQVTSGIRHVEQPEATVRRLYQAVAALPPFVMAGVSPLVSLTGSLVATLALIEDAVDPDTVWNAAHVDEHWQAELWGADAEATALLESRRVEFDDCVRFSALASG